MLDSYFNLSERASSENSAINRLFEGATVEPGTYNSGLVTVVDEDLGISLMQPWLKITGENSVALVVTAFGDILYYNREKQAAHILLTQYARTNHISQDVGRAISEWLVIPGVIEDSLKINTFSKLHKLHGPLTYGNTFILEPLLVNGGESNVENYSVGDMEVYLDIVSQNVCI